MYYKEEAVTCKLSGDKIPVLKTIEKMENCLKFAYKSNLRDNSDGGVHIFITLLQDVEVE